MALFYGQDITNEVYLYGVGKWLHPEFWHVPTSPVLELTPDDLTMPFAMLWCPADWRGRQTGSYEPRFITQQDCAGYVLRWHKNGMAYEMVAVEDDHGVWTHQINVSLMQPINKGS